MANEVFSARAPSDISYIAVRDDDRFADAREHLCLLWAKFSEFSDPRFLDEIGKQFLQRYWEMRLGCTLLDLGFHLAPPTLSGPDFDATTSDGNRVYIEAIAVGPGEGIDAVPEPNYGAKEAELYPTDKVILRVRAAIAAKTKQHESYIENASIDNSVPYVVAINIGGITRATISHAPPTLAQACLGVGSLVASFGPDEPTEIYLGRRDAVSKGSGSNVDTRIFLTPEYSWLSGAILSDVSAFRLPIGAGDFQFLHNPNATNPVCEDWLPIGSEHWWDDGRLHNRWRNPMGA